MAMFTAQLSDWRVTQFRRALRAAALSCGDAEVDRLHDFDSAIRSALLVRIERIELALRGSMTTTCESMFGLGWHIEARAFRPGTDVRAVGSQLRSALNRSADPASRAVLARVGFDGVPFGLVAEHLSLGATSRLVGLLDPSAAREIAHTFDLPAPTLRGTLQHVTHVRNRCAHHTGVWGTRFGIPAPKYRSPARLVAGLHRTTPRSPYRSLVLIDHMTECVDPDQTRSEALEQLLDEHQDLLAVLGAAQH